MKYQEHIKAVGLIAICSLFASAFVILPGLAISAWVDDATDRTEPDHAIRERTEAVAVAWWAAMGRPPERVLCSPIRGSGRALRFVRCAAMFPSTDQHDRQRIEAFDCDPDAGDCEVR